MSHVREFILLDPNDPTRKGEFDTTFQIPVFIGVEHHQVHKGLAFKSDFVDEAMGDNDTLILAFKTPAGTKRVHMIFEATTLVGGSVEVFEGATWDNQSGTLNPILNRKRLASMTESGVLEDQAQAAFVASNNVIANPTGVAGGTSIHHLFIWGKKEKIGAGNVRDTNEIVLKPDTQYAVVFTAEGASNKGQVILNWYEHTDE